MEQIKRIQALLFGSAVILMALGIVMIYSASAIYAFDTMKDSLFFLKRHMLYLGLGVFFCYVFSNFDYRKYRKASKYILGAVIILLVLVLIPHIGHASGGARRWFKFMGFSFQPSEFLKLALIFYLADFLDKRKHAM